MEDYSAKLTAEPFLYNETKIIATYLLNGEDEELLKKKIVWKKFKEDNDSNNIFYVELKKRSLKIEWKNNENANIEIVEKLKKISREIIESLNKK